MPHSHRGCLSNCPGNKTVRFAILLVAAPLYLRSAVFNIRCRLVLLWLGHWVSFTVQFLIKNPSPWQGPGFALNLISVDELLLLLVEGGIESDVAAFEVETAHEAGGFGGAVDAVHVDVLPFDGEGALVADVVEGDDDVLELDVTATG